MHVKLPCLLGGMRGSGWSIEQCMAWRDACQRLSMATEKRHQKRARCALGVAVKGAAI